jgi:hypothetical protein
MDIIDLRWRVKHLHRTVGYREQNQSRMSAEETAYWMKRFPQIRAREARAKFSRQRLLRIARRRLGRITRR